MHENQRISPWITLYLFILEGNATFSSYRFTSCCCVRAPGAKALDASSVASRVGQVPKRGALVSGT
jgi:hypothetical protein